MCLCKKFSGKHLTWIINKIPPLFKDRGQEVRRLTSFIGHVCDGMVSWKTCKKKTSSMTVVADPGFSKPQPFVLTQLYPQGNPTTTTTSCASSGTARGQLRKVGAFNPTHEHTHTHTREIWTLQTFTIIPPPAVVLQWSITQGPAWFFSLSLPGRPFHGNIWFP